MPHRLHSSENPWSKRTSEVVLWPPHVAHALPSSPPSPSFHPTQAHIDNIYKDNNDNNKLLRILFECLNWHMIFHIYETLWQLNLIYIHSVQCSEYGIQMSVSLNLCHSVVLNSKFPSFSSSHKPIITLAALLSNTRTYSQQYFTARYLKDLWAPRSRSLLWQACSDHFLKMNILVSM